ncbi:MAG: aminopeptidase N [Parvibaculaceae bacterium]
MRTETPQSIRLEDYRPPAWSVTHISLTVRLEPAETEVEAVLDVVPGADTVASQPLELDGENLELLAVTLDGTPLADADYELRDDRLIIRNPPGRAFRLETRVRCNPEANTALSGLYRSNGIYCTQCEAEGFRRITYFLDRPDVLARYQVRIEADAKACPVLLSNGNFADRGSLPDGRHYVLWIDPFPKPSYLFALVAGDLAWVEDDFVTMSGRKVALRIFVEHGKEDRCDWAMASLKKAMKWDEQAFGREYDLDIFMIVAVSDFNMGAMENKGLNVFNDKYILARPDTATDVDYANIEAIIAHEYFHNWSGNRITCRDWFQLCLKEGLTVFRDQEFTSDIRSRAVKRIIDVKTLRAQQFPEDAGPLAHPVRPSSYIEINNFYTATVYEKGAELVRMLKTLIGEEAFRRAMDLYFAFNDGRAATVEDFVDAMREASGRDLTQFFRWYEQAGTPWVTAESTWDRTGRTFDLTLTQLTKPTPGQSDKPPLQVPLTLGLIGPDGADMPLDLEGVGFLNAPLIELTERTQRFRFNNVAERPVLSLNRGFSAPIRLTTNASAEDRLFVAARDSDPFNRWEASQTIARDLILAAMTAIGEGAQPAEPEAYARSLAATLAEEADDPAFLALMLTLPPETEIATDIGKDVDPGRVHAAREHVRAGVGRLLAAELERLWLGSNPAGSYSPDAESAGLRALRHAALEYLVAANPSQGARIASAYFRAASTMTETMGALMVLTRLDAPEREEALETFYEAHRDDSLIVDKWLSLHALAPFASTPQRLRGLLEHESFSLTRPNRVRALIGTLALSNPVAFHAADGEGYRLVADVVLALDPLNPQVAARIATSFRSWRMLEAGRQAHARGELERMKGQAGLSRDVYEIAARCLGEA